MTHSSLDRHLALQLATYIRSGDHPPLLAAAEQLKRAAPLKDMLELNGWSIGTAPSFAFTIRKASRFCTVGVIPALYDRNSLPTSWSPATPFSTHEIDKDLPTCLLKVPS